MSYNGKKKIKQDWKVKNIESVRIRSNGKAGERKSVWKIRFKVEKKKEEKVRKRHWVKEKKKTIKKI